MVRRDPESGDTEAWTELYAKFLEWPADAEGLRVIPTNFETSDGYAIGRCL